MIDENGEIVKRKKKKGLKEKIKENQEKIKLNKQLPYLVGNIVEVGCAATPSDSFPNC